MLIRLLVQVRQWGRCGLGTALTIQCLRKELPHSLPGIGSKKTNEIFDQIRRRTPEIAEEDASWCQDVPSRQHLEWASSVLAAYEAIRPHVENDDAAVELLASSNLRGWDSWMTRKLVAYLPRAIQPFPRSPRKLMNALLSQYGMPWRWKAIKREDGGYEVILHHCFYHAFMVSHGCPKLAKAFCRIDTAWIDRIDPAKHGIRFATELHTTLANGDERCCFPLIPVTVSARERS